MRVNMNVKVIDELLFVSDNLQHMLAVNEFRE